MKTKAIKIDVVKKAVYEIEIEAEDLQALYDAVGNNCSNVEAPVIYPNGDIMYTDGEKLVNGTPMVGGFSFKGWAFPIPSNAIIIGDNGMGGMANVKSKLKDFKMVKFYTAAHIRNFYAGMNPYTVMSR